MYKKFLSLTLCIALMFTLAMIPASAAEGGFVFSQDYEDADFSEMTISVGNDTAERIVDDNGNAVIDIDARNGNYLGVVESGLTPSVRGSNYVVQFDVKAIDVSGPLCFVIKNSALSAKWQGVNIFPGCFAPVTKETSSLVNGGDGEWFTMRITVDETQYKADNDIGRVFDVQIRKLGESSWTTLTNPGGTYVDRAGFRPRTAGDNHIRLVPTMGNVAIGVSRGCQNSFGTNTPHYQIDNVTVFAIDQTVVSGAWFKDSSNEIVNSVPDGEVTANFNINNFGGLTSAKVVFAAYGENGEFITTETADVSIGRKNVNVSATFDAEGLECERLEAYLCLDDSLFPIPGIKGILGKAEEVEKSETSANLGTDGEEDTYSFDAFDRSVVVNQVTVEGEHSKGEITPVIVEAIGKTSGKTLYFRQFSTKDDGTFKISFEYVPEECELDENAVITVKSADTTSKTFEIPVFSNWDAMVADFADAEDMESYIESYLDNLTVYESGKTDATKADVEGIDYAEMAFIKSMNEYAEDMTYAEAVATVLGLIEDTREAEVFAEAFVEAQALETEAEQIEAIKALITECEIIEFSTVGASNVDAICKALISSEAITLEGIYADFYVAYTNQKTAEEATVPGFTSITSGAEMKQFFADNEIVLGVDPEKYSDADYAVMYGVYEEKEYSTLASYEAVNEAIVFLDNYINEYNQFIALITNAATVEKNRETIKGLLNNNYTYIEIDLADESAVVNKEYLYNRLIDMDCTSLDSIEAAFSDAVAKQSAYETAAKDAFITIMDEASVRAYFAEYGDMLGASEAKNYTDAELKVFVEVYNKFRPTATNYSEAKEQTEELIGKHKKAVKFIADINKEAEAKNWAGLKALYEGDVCSEFVGMDTATSEINDIRSMYMRIANNAPYGTLAEIETAWNNAYSDQDAYEDVAGGYETFDDELCYFDDTAWSLDVQGNVVTVNGKVDALGERYITLYAESGDSLIYIKQAKSKANGEFEVRFILNPEIYADGETAVLHVSGDSMNIYTFGEFDLYSEEELQAMVDGFLEIDSKSDIKAYLEGYADALSVEVDTNDDRLMEALFFLYEKEKKEGKYESISDVNGVLGKAENSGMLSIMVQMDEMIRCLDDLTAAANKKVGSTLGQWKIIKNQVQTAIRNEWISPDVSGKISDEASMYLRMAGETYNYMSEVESGYEVAYAKQYKDESKETDKKPSSGGGEGFGGGGNAGSGSSLPIKPVSGSDESKKDTIGIGTDYIPETGDILTNQSAHPEAPFTDVTSEYSWAKTGIDGLRKNGIIRGDGNGLFRPGDGISREEFLTILLRVFDLDVKESSASFSDVDKNAWYYDAVATAYEMGIVKGYTDGRFGIGDIISREDMAVMVCRTMEMLNINLDATEKAVAFTDYTSISDYAYHSVAKLQQAGVLSGDDVGRFNPQNKLKRAEAAVVFWSVYVGVNDFVAYSGVIY